MLDLGLASVRIRLEGTTDLKDALAKVRAYAEQHSDRAWIQGGGWNQVTWNLGRFPLATELDTAVPDRPAVLGRVDGHAVWLNTRALSAAGITRDTTFRKMTYMDWTDVLAVEDWHVAAALRFIPLEQLEEEGYGEYLSLFQGAVGE